MSTGIQSIIERMDKIELVDVFESVGATKDEVITPYLKDLFKDLTARSETQGKGIARVVLLEVHVVISLVLPLARTDR